MCPTGGGYYTRGFQNNRIKEKREMINKRVMLEEGNEHAYLDVYAAQELEDFKRSADRKSTRLNSSHA